jgi:chromosome segregation ATPase
MQQKQQMLKHEQKELKDMQGNLKFLLKSYGFSIDSNGAVTNSVAKLRQLEMAVESAKKKQDAYTGDNKTTQKNLQTAYDNANDKLQRAKETLNQFYDVSSQIGETANEWEELKQSIEEAKNEIAKAKIEQQMLGKELKTQKLENEYDTLIDKLEILQSKIDLETDEKKRIKLLKQQSALIDQQQNKLNETKKSYQDQANYYKNYLKQKGFSFDADGNANATRLQSLVNEADYETTKEVYELYTELNRDTIPSLQQEWYDLEKEQRDAKEEIKELNEQLEKTQKELKELEKIKAFDFLDELIDKQDKLNNQMDLLETKMELVYGDKNKTKALQEQITLIKKQLKAQEEVNKQLEKQRQYLYSEMYNKGFRFDKNGNATNIDSVLNKAKTKEEYEELKELAEEYYDTQNQIDEGTIAWYEYKNQIAEANKEIEIMQEELKQLKVEANLTQLTNEVTKLANEYDRLETMKGLDGANTLDILNQQIGLLDEQKKATEDLLAFRRKQAEDLKSELSDYGFKFDEEGLVQNASKTIESLKNTLSEDEFEKVNNSLEEYFDVSLNEIDDLEKELLEFEKTYEDIQREKLNATKKIEDEITKIYEKQIEERIEQIEKERDAQVESLNKAKEAYQRYRDEVDYEDSYNEQLSKVQELQAQIEIAKRDDSLSGKKRLEDLMEQLNEEQKTLEDLVQDKIDSDINTMFDDQIENIEKNAEEQMEDLENTFSETKIAEMVANAIQTGIFEDIDGNIVSLDTALMDFANNSTEYLGIMGESLKTELLDNLNIALDTMQQLNNINSELKQGQMTNKAVGVMPIDKSIGEIKNDAMSSQVISRDIAIGDMSITIQGNATPETVEDIRVALNEYIETMKKEIWTNVK